MWKAWGTRWIALLALCGLWGMTPCYADPVFSVKIPTDYVAILYPLLVTPDRFFLRTTPTKDHPLAGVCGMDPDSADAQQVEDAWSYEQAQSLKDWVIQNRNTLLVLLKDPVKLNSLRTYLDARPEIGPVLRIFTDMYYRGWYQCMGTISDLDTLGMNVSALPQTIQEWVKINGYPALVPYQPHPKTHVWTIKEEHEVKVIVVMVGLLLLWGVIERWRKEDVETV